MTLLTALRWINGATLLIVLSMWLVFGILQALGRFFKSAATVAWNTGVMFASGFQKNPRNPEPPGVEWETIFFVVTLAVLWFSILVPSRVWLLHACAVAAGLLMAWAVWMLRASVLGQCSMGAVALWFCYYWAAAWRNSLP